MVRQAHHDSDFVILSLSKDAEGLQRGPSQSNGFDNVTLSEVEGSA